MPISLGPLQGSLLFYFTSIEATQPRGIIPLENAEVSTGEPGKPGDRRAKYMIRVDVDPNAEVRKRLYLLSARSTAGLKEWVAVCALC